MIGWFKNVFWYIIDKAFTALPCVLEYAYDSQERYDESCRCNPLPELYLIHIKAKDVDKEPRFLPIVPDRFKTWEMYKKAVKEYL